MGHTIDRIQVLTRVQSIVVSELKDESLTIDDATEIGDLPNWDSVAHFRIVIALENEFGFQFELDEHTAFETVGQLVDCACSKLSATNI